MIPTSPFITESILVPFSCSYLIKVTASTLAPPKSCIDAAIL